jgi:flagellar hook-basal body complex protein FliE
MNSSTPSINIIRPLTGVGEALGKSVVTTGTGFKDAMLQALQSTSDLQKESGRLAKDFQLEKSTASLEETMLAGVKSNISFQATLQVRNRVVQAYTDVMNMQV